MRTLLTQWRQKKIINSKSKHSIVYVYMHVSAARTGGACVKIWGIYSNIRIAQELRVHTYKRNC